MPPADGGGPALLTIAAVAFVLICLALIRAFVRSPKDRVPQSQGVKRLPFFWRAVRSDYLDVKWIAESEVLRRSDAARAIWSLKPIDTFSFGYYLTGFEAEPETFSLALVAVRDSEIVFVDADPEIDSRWELGRVRRSELRAVEVEALPAGAQVLKVEEGRPEYDPYDAYLWWKTDIFDKFNRPVAGKESMALVTRGSPVTHQVVIRWEVVEGLLEARFAFATKEVATQAAARLGAYMTGHWIDAT